MTHSVIPPSLQAQIDSFARQRAKSGQMGAKQADLAPSPPEKRLTPRLGRAVQPGEAIYCWWLEKD